MAAPGRGARGCQALVRQDSRSDPSGQGLTVLGARRAWLADRTHRHPHGVPINPPGRESELAAELGAQPPEALTAGGVAVERCGEIVDRPAPSAATEAVPAALGRLVDVQACMPVLVERARHLAMTRNLDTKQPPDVN